jgi:hypothetical protein
MKNMSKKSLFKMGQYFSSNEDKLFTAIMSNDAKKVKKLLKKANPAVYENTAIRTACMMNNNEIIEILLNDTRVDPSTHNNSCLLWACNNDNIEIAALLLEDPRVDPTTAISYALSLKDRTLFNLMKTNQHIDPLKDYSYPKWARG